MNSQRPVYKALRIKKRIRESYENHLRTFYPSLTNKNKSIAVIRVYRQLKEEIRYRQL